MALKLFDRAELKGVAGKFLEGDSRMTLAMPNFAVERN
jgi:hypothetical protein